jgi:hypothetical protein
LHPLLISTICSSWGYFYSDEARGACRAGRPASTFDFAGLTGIYTNCAAHHLYLKSFSDLIHSLVSLKHAVGATFWEVLMGLGDLFKKFFGSSAATPVDECTLSGTSRSHHHWRSLRMARAD